MTQSDKRVLSGVRIIDFSRLLPGPWATQMLADLGADVIKVEQPEVGDYSRHNPPKYRDSSVYYNSVNSNKRSIAIDLANPNGQAVAHRLIEKSDVIMESFRTGVAKKLDVHYEKARALNPGIVYCAITGYGQDGPLARVPGHDLVIQSMTGLMGMSVDREPLPPVPGFQAADYAGGAMAPTAILAALMRKQQTGEGCYIDLSMFDCLFYMCNIVQTGGMSRLAGHSGEPAMQPWGDNPRYATYLCGDGKPVAVSLLGGGAVAAVLLLHRTARADPRGRGAGGPPLDPWRPRATLPGRHRELLQGAYPRQPAGQDGGGTDPDLRDLYAGRGAGRRQCRAAPPGRIR